MGFFKCWNKKYSGTEQCANSLLAKWSRRLRGENKDLNVVNTVNTLEQLTRENTSLHTELTALKIGIAEAKAACAKDNLALKEQNDRITAQIKDGNVAGVVSELKNNLTQKDSELATAYEQITTLQIQVSQTVTQDKLNAALAQIDDLQHQLQNNPNLSPKKTKESELIQRLEAKIAQLERKNQSPASNLDEVAALKRDNGQNMAKLVDANREIEQLKQQLARPAEKEADLIAAEEEIAELKGRLENRSPISQKGRFVELQERVRKAETELHTAKKAVERLNQQKCPNLQEIIDELRVDDVDSILESVRMLKQEKEKLQEKVEECDIQSFDEAVAGLEVQIREGRKENEELAQQFNDKLESDRQEIDLLLGALTAVIKTPTFEFDTENKVLVQIFKNFKESAASCEAKTEELKNAYSSSLAEEKKSHAALLAAAEETIRKQLESAKQKGNADTITALQQRIAALTASNAELTAANQKESVSHAELLAELRNEVAQTKANSETSKSSCEQKETEFAAAKEGLENEIAASKAQIAALSEQIAAVQTLTQENERIKLDYAKLEVRIRADKEGHTKKLESERKLFETERSKNEAELAANSLKLKEQEQQIQQLKADLKETEKHKPIRADLEAKIAQYTATIAEQTVQLEKLPGLKQELAQKSAKIEEQKAQTEQLPGLKQELAQKSAKIEEQKAQTEQLPKLKQEIAQASAKIKEQETRLAANAGELKQKSEQITALQSGNDETKRLQAEVDKQKKTNKDLAEENKQLAADKAGLQTQLQGCTTITSTFDRELDELLTSINKPTTNRSLKALGAIFKQMEADFQKSTEANNTTNAAALKDLNARLDKCFAEKLETERLAATGLSVRDKSFQAEKQAVETKLKDLESKTRAEKTEKQKEIAALLLKVEENERIVAAERVLVISAEAKTKELEAELKREKETLKQLAKDKQAADDVSRRVSHELGEIKRKAAEEKAQAAEAARRAAREKAEAEAAALRAAQEIEAAREAAETAIRKAAEDRAAEIARANLVSQQDIDKFKRAIQPFEIPIKYELVAGMHKDQYIEILQQIFDEYKAELDKSYQSNLPCIQSDRESMQIVDRAHQGNLISPSVDNFQALNKFKMVMAEELSNLIGGVGQIFLKIRPAEPGANPFVQKNPDNTVHFSDLSKRDVQVPVQFKQVFDGHETGSYKFKTYFSKEIDNYVQRRANKREGSIPVFMAFGQSGSGKSFSLCGGTTGKGKAKVQDTESILDAVLETLEKHGIQGATFQISQYYINTNIADVNNGSFYDLKLERYPSEDDYISSNYAFNRDNLSQIQMTVISPKGYWPNPDYLGKDTVDWKTKRPMRVSQEPTSSQYDDYIEKHVVPLDSWKINTLLIKETNRNIELTPEFLRHYYNTGRITRSMSALNNASSRSHVFVQINFKVLDSDGKQQPCEIHIIDLAGNESSKWPKEGMASITSLKTEISMIGATLNNVKQAILHKRVRKPFVDKDVRQSKFTNRINDLFEKKSKVYFIFTIRGGYEQTDAQNKLILATGTGIGSNDTPVDEKLCTIQFAKELLETPEPDCGQKPTARQMGRTNSQSNVLQGDKKANVAQSTRSTARADNPIQTYTKPPASTRQSRLTGKGGTSKVKANQTRKQQKPRWTRRLRKF